MDTSVSFKIFFANDNVRRFRNPSRPSFEEFVNQMQKLYSPNFHPELRIQYVDSEGDKIDVTSELEWQEMFQELKGQIIKLYIVETNDKKYFKDGPAPELVTVYSDPTDPKPEPSSDNWSSLHDRVSRSLANLFPGGKILPLNLPSFLEGTVSLKPRDDNLVDLDVEVSQLSTVLGKRAYFLLTNSPSKADLYEAKTCLISQLILYPSDCVAHYNLGCTEALLDNVPAALAAIEKSIMNGYGDADHLSTDEDLRSLHGLPRFLELIELARVGVVQEVPQEEVKIPEPEPEPERPTLLPPELAAIFGDPQPAEIEDFSLSDFIDPEPKPEPEPVIVPVPVPEQPRKWDSELKVLADMGFLDESILVMTLDQTSGDVAQALTSLLG